MNNSTIGKNKKIATGWLMVIACMLVQAIPYCIVAIHKHYICIQ